MISADKKETLTAKIKEGVRTLRGLLEQIKNIEKDNVTSVNEKLSQIKKIQEEITKVGTEIDSIKKEIMLLTDYSIN
jgi:flagellar hook-associated protein FlgK